MRATWQILLSTFVLAACVPSSGHAPARHGSVSEHQGSPASNDPTASKHPPASGHPVAGGQPEEARAGDPRTAGGSDEADGVDGSDAPVVEPPGDEMPPGDEKLPPGDGCLARAAAGKHEAEVTRENRKAREAAIAAAGLQRVELPVRQVRRSERAVAPGRGRAFPKPWTVSQSKQGTRELAGPIIRAHCPKDVRRRSKPPTFVADADGTIYRLALHPREQGTLTLHVCGCPLPPPPSCGAYMPLTTQARYTLPEGARWGGKRALSYPRRAVRRTYEKTSRRECPPPPRPP